MAAEAARKSNEDLEEDESETEDGEDPFRS